MVRYRHPKHGYHLAGYGEDVAALEAAGWVLDEPAPAAPSSPPEPSLAQPAPAPEPTPPRREWRPKRGR